MGVKTIKSYIDIYTRIDKPKAMTRLKYKEIMKWYNGLKVSYENELKVGN